jgi:hypothetical protein
VELARKHRLRAEASSDCPVMAAGSLDGSRQMDAAYMEVEKAEGLNRAARR